MKEPPEWKQLREQGHKVTPEIRALWKEVVKSEDEMAEAFDDVSPEVRRALEALLNHVEHTQAYHFTLHQTTTMNAIVAAIS